MEFKTRISKIEENDVDIRGEKLSSLIQGRFTDAVFLELSGRKPNENESVLFEKILICVIDHGMGTTSSMATRFVASGGNSLNTAVGGGILSIGNYHGGAMENAMKMIASFKDIPKEDLLSKFKEMLTNRQVIYGIGHKHYKQGDPRVQWLLKTMNEIGYESLHLHFKDAIEKAFEEVKGKKIHMNVDGLIAILLSDWGFDPLLGKGIFIIGRTPGLVAQAYEELKFEKPVRRVSEDEIEYLSE
jgi:citryl-CoA lyase